MEQWGHGPDWLWVNRYVDGSAFKPSAMLTPCQVKTGKGFVRCSTGPVGKYYIGNHTTLVYADESSGMVRRTVSLKTSSHGSPVYLSCFMVSIKRSSWPLGWKSYNLLVHTQ